MVLSCFILLDRKIAAIKSPLFPEERKVITQEKLYKRFKIIHHKAMYIAFLFDPFWLAVFPEENIASMTFAD